MMTRPVEDASPHCNVLATQSTEGSQEQSTSSSPARECVPTAGGGGGGGGGGRGGVPTVCVHSNASVCKQPRQQAGYLGMTTLQ